MSPDRPTVEELKTLFRYNGDTGIVTWARNQGHMKAGSRAGSEHKSNTGHRSRCIKIRKMRFEEHRIIWALQTGAWPPDDMFVDHADCDSLNNRFDNLRLATQTQNNVNCRARRNNKSGVKGAHFHRIIKKWQARLFHKGKTLHLGCFETKEEASAAYFAKAKELFGEFARIE